MEKKLSNWSINMRQPTLTNKLDWSNWREVLKNYQVKLSNELKQTNKISLREDNLSWTVQKILYNQLW